MANSSDWIAAHQSSQSASNDQEPVWIERLQKTDTFVEGFPVHASETPVRVPDPLDEVSTEPVETNPETDLVAEAFAQGEASGRAKAEAEYADAIEHQRAVRLNFRALDQEAMDSLAAELSETVLSLCSATLAEYEPDAAALMKRCEGAARRLGSAVEKCALHLHPDDVALIESDIGDQWRIVADPGVERAGLRFEGPDGAISDGPPEWRRAIAAALEG